MKKNIMLFAVVLVLLMMLCSCGEIDQGTSSESLNSDTDITTDVPEAKIDVDAEALKPELPTDLSCVRYYDRVYNGNKLIYSSTHLYYSNSYDLSQFPKESDGSTIQEAYYYVKDNNGKILKKYTFYAFERCYVEVDSYEYDNKGRVSKIIKISSDIPESFSIEDFDYNWAYKKTEPQIIFEEHPVDSIVEYTYFEDDEFTGTHKSETVIIYREDGSEIEKNIIEYSLDGTLKKIHYENGEYVRESSGTWTITENHKADNSKKETSNPTNEIIREKINDYKYKEYKYSQNGFLIYEATYDNEIKTSQTVYQYDSYGNIVKEMQFAQVN